MDDIFVPQAFVISNYDGEADSDNTLYSYIQEHFWRKCKIWESNQRLHYDGFTQHDTGFIMRDWFC